MNRDDIIRMAREAGQADGTTPLERNIVLYAAKSSLFLEKFANLVAAAEREACAKVCLDVMNNWKKSEDNSEYTRPDGLDCADAIRARGQV